MKTSSLIIRDSKRGGRIKGLLKSADRRNRSLLPNVSR